MPIHRLRVLSGAALLVLSAGLVPRAASAQQLDPVTVSFDNTAVTDVLAFFATYAHRSIIAGVGVEGVVSARIERQPWDVALASIIESRGLVGRELDSGIIVVENPASVIDAPIPLVTRVFRLDYVPAAELQAAVASTLSKRGTVSPIPSMNALVVTDEPRVLEKVAALLGKQ